MRSEAFVQLALEKLGCSQKELAVIIKVSAAQITKWKNGDYMSAEMEKEFKTITAIRDNHPAVVLWTGSVDQAEKWGALIRFLAKSASDNDESGYVTRPLERNDPDLTFKTLSIVRDLGVKIPAVFPAEINFDFDSDGDENDFVDLWQVVEKSSVAKLIYKIFESFTDVYGFYVAYIEYLFFEDDLDLSDEPIEKFDDDLMALAASKIDVDETIAPKFNAFSFQVKRDFRDLLINIKRLALRAGVPLKVELLDLVNRAHDELGNDAERESLGLNKANIHPDVYMNELLVGMRTIHQVLPAILKKLEIYDDFRLDESDLRAD